MEYTPRIESMKNVASAPLKAGLTVMLFDTIKSTGSIQYSYLVGVFDDATRQPVYFVASEVNAEAATLGGGSHYLGVFPGNGHFNRGSSDEWGDPRKFFPKALDIVKAHFGVEPEMGGYSEGSDLPKP